MRDFDYEMIAIEEFVKEHCPLVKLVYDKTIKEFVLREKEI